MSKCTHNKHIGVIVLTNQSNVGFPDAIGAWTFDQLLRNSPVDHVAEALKRATKEYSDNDEMFAKPANPRPFPPVAPLTGSFANPSFGKELLKHEGDALVLELRSGAQLKLEPWDGDIFTARLASNGRFAPVAENLGPQPSGFVQFQMSVAITRRHCAPLLQAKNESSARLKLFVGQLSH